MANDRKNPDMPILSSTFCRWGQDPTAVVEFFEGVVKQVLAVRLAYLLRSQIISLGSSNESTVLEILSSFAHSSPLQLNLGIPEGIRARPDLPEKAAIPLYLFTRDDNTAEWPKLTHLHAHLPPQLANGPVSPSSRLLFCPVLHPSATSVGRHNADTFTRSVGLDYVLTNLVERCTGQSDFDIAWLFSLTTGAQHWHGEHWRLITWLRRLERDSPQPFSYTQIRSLTNSYIAGVVRVQNSAWEKWNARRPDIWNKWLQAGARPTLLERAVFVACSCGFWTTSTTAETFRLPLADCALVFADLSTATHASKTFSTAKRVANQHNTIVPARTGSIATSFIASDLATVVTSVLANMSHQLSIDTQAVAAALPSGSQASKFILPDMATALHSLATARTRSGANKRYTDVAPYPSSSPACFYVLPDGATAVASGTTSASVDRSAAAGTLSLFTKDTVALLPDLNSALVRYYAARGSRLSIAQTELLPLVHPAAVGTFVSPRLDTIAVSRGLVTSATGQHRKQVVPTSFTFKEAKSAMLMLPSIDTLVGKAKNVEYFRRAPKVFDRRGRGSSA